MREDRPDDDRVTLDRDMMRRFKGSAMRVNFRLDVMIVVLAVSLVAGSARAAEVDAPEYEDLPGSMRTMLEKYAERCFRYDGKIWYADPAVYAQREFNTQAMANRSFVSGSTRRTTAYAFEEGQRVPPIAYDLVNARYVGAMDDRMRLVYEFAQPGAGKGPDLTVVTQGGEAKKGPPGSGSSVTGEELYGLIAGAGLKLPDLYAKKEVHDPAVYQERRSTSGGVTITKKVRVRDETHRLEWHSRPHASYNQAVRAVELHRRAAEVAAKRLMVLEKNLTEALRNDPSRKQDAERLVVMYVFEGGSPTAADAYLPLVDAEFAEAIGLAQRKVKTLTAGEALKLGDWCDALRRDERYDGVEPLRTRAARCYERYLEAAGDAVDAEARANVQAKIDELSG